MEKTIVKARDEKGEGMAQVLPKRLETGDKWDFLSGASAFVLVRAEGWSGLHIGRYYHEIGAWSIYGPNARVKVIEWWPLPEHGTGTKVE